MVFVRNPQYFGACLPYIDRVEWLVDEDSASRMSNFLAGKYDIGFDGGVIFRTEWAQIREPLRQRRPNLKIIDIVTTVMSHLSMRTDRPPFSDVRVPQTTFFEPDSYLYSQYMPGEPRNQSHVNDPVVADLIVRQRRTFDVGKRREIVHEIQRHLAKQQYYVSLPSGLAAAVWDGALRN